jgi:hypothetical protein
MSEADVEQLRTPLEELESDFRGKQSTGEIPPHEELMRRLAEWESRYA